MPTNRHTLLRQVTKAARAATLPEAIRVVGVDDWAWSKGQSSFGTILVDLERGEVVDLLPVRSADTLSQWLIQHPLESVNVPKKPIMKQPKTLIAMVPQGKLLLRFRVSRVSPNRDPTQCTTDGYPQIRHDLPFFEAASYQSRRSWSRSKA
jgi:transposase